MCIVSENSLFCSFTMNFFFLRDANCDDWFQKLEVKTDTTQLIFYLKKKMRDIFSRPLIFIIFFVEYLRSGSDCTEQNLKKPNNRTCTNSEPKQKFRWNLIFFKNSNETFLRFLTDEFFMMILKTTMLITEFQISFGIWAKSYESVM